MHLSLKDFEGSFVFERFSKARVYLRDFRVFFFISQRHPDSPQSKSGLNSSCKEALVPMLSYSSITIIFYAIAHICFRKSFKNFERTRRMTCFEVVPLLLHIYFSRKLKVGMSNSD